MTQALLTCQHKPCQCEVGEEGAFCSGFCKEAWDDNLSDPICRCGHTACRSVLEDGAEGQIDAS